MARNGGVIRAGVELGVCFQGVARAEAARSAGDEANVLLGDLSIPLSVKDHSTNCIVYLAHPSYQRASKLTITNAIEMSTRLPAGRFVSSYKQI